MYHCRACTLLGCICLLLAGIPVLFFKYGARLRSMSRLVSLVMAFSCVGTTLKLRTFGRLDIKHTPRNVGAFPIVITCSISISIEYRPSHMIIRKSCERSECGDFGSNQRFLACGRPYWTTWSEMPLARSACTHMVKIRTDEVSVDSKHGRRVLCLSRHLVT